MEVIKMPIKMTNKQKQRIERKKKKICAFLTIARLNDQDRTEKLEAKNETEFKNADADAQSHLNDNPMAGDGPCRKRIRKESNDQVSCEMFEEVPENNQNPFAVDSYNFPCFEDPYYRNPFINHSFNRIYETDNCYRYQSYEVYRHHNSETFYFKTNENVCPVINDETWNELKNLNEKKPLLEGESYEALKKRLRERQNFFKNIPRLLLKESGEAASLERDFSERIPIFINDVQDLIVYSQTGHTFYNPRWCLTEKMNRLSKTIILVVEGISSDEYILNESSFPVLKNNFPIKVEVLMPKAYDGNLLEELTNVPICPSNQKKLIHEYKTIDAALENNLHIRYKVLRAMFPIQLKKDADVDVKLPETDRFSRTELLLSAWQLVEDKYPLPIKGRLKEKYRDYVMTKDTYAEVNHFSPMFGLDCEMCRTEIGVNELARISIVDENLTTIYDTLVKPRNKITDYLTRFSGITKKMLDPVTTRIEDVQNKIREILPPDAILVGQSLHFDFHAMKMFHPYVIDTGTIFNITGIRSKKSKLVTITQEFLNEKIQQSSHGHCPVEDSLACMKLVKLKLANSIEFGDAVLVGIPTAELHLKEIQTQNRNKGKSTENVIQVVGGEQLTTSLFFQIANGDKKVGAVGIQSTVDGYCDINANKSNEKTKTNVRGYVAATNGDVINRSCEVAEENDCLVTHVFLEEDEIDIKIKKINKWTKKMLKITPLNGMCLVLLGNGASEPYGVCCININKPTAPASIS